MQTALFHENERKQDINHLMKKGSHPPLLRP